MEYGYLAGFEDTESITRLIDNVPERDFFRLALRLTLVVECIMEQRIGKLFLGVTLEKTYATRTQTSLVPRHRSLSYLLHAPTKFSSNSLKPGWLF